MSRTSIQHLRLLLSLLLFLATASSDVRARACAFEGFYDAGADTTEPYPVTSVASASISRQLRVHHGIAMTCPDSTYSDIEQPSAAYCRSWCSPGFVRPIITIDYPGHTGIAAVHGPVRVLLL